MTWLRSYPTTGPGRSTTALVCLPHAGGAASAYAGWRPLLPTGWRLLAAKYPEREDRITDPPAGSIADMVDAIAAETFTAVGDQEDLVLFGHSMGGAIARDIAAALLDRGRRPRALAISAVSPDVATRGLIVRPGPGEPTLAEQLADLDPAFGQLDAYPELRDHALTVVTHDADLLAGWIERPDVLDGVPVLALSGSEDPSVSAEDVQQWRTRTTGPFVHESLPGGHFYLREQTSAVIAALVRIADSISRP